MGGYILNAINMYPPDTLELLIVWNHNGINMYPAGKRVLVPSVCSLDWRYIVIMNERGCFVMVMRTGQGGMDTVIAQGCRHGRGYRVES